MNSRIACLLVSLLWIATAHAGEAVFKASKAAPLDEVYVGVYQALEQHKFFVVFEADMGRNMARFAERWGEDYNRSRLDQIKAMVVCNVWYTNQVSNLDPDMLSLCPLSVALTEKDGVSTVMFARPTAVAGDSPALPVLKEVEDEIVKAIREGLE